jgi:hypothetical protein
MATGIFRSRIVDKGKGIDSKIHDEGYRAGTTACRVCGN